MIVVNGAIQIKEKTGGGLDADGYPTKPSESFAPPISCHVRLNRKDNLGKQDGNTFVIASYEALIEPQTFEAERVRLTKNGRDLGEFSVLFAELLDAVGALRIVV